MQWSHIKRNGAYRDKASEHERRASKLLPMSSVTHPLIHGQEASGMEAALTPWFHRYDIMMDHCCSFTLPLIIAKVPWHQELPPDARVLVYGPTPSISGRARKEESLESQLLNEEAQSLNHYVGQALLRLVADLNSCSFREALLRRFAIDPAEDHCNEAEYSASKQ